MCRQSLAVHLVLKMAIVLMHADLEPVALMSIRYVRWNELRRA
jgi:hypothetical protein